MTASERPSVDVLIVSFNTKDILRDCLRSLDRHRPPEADLRVSVLDNASADGSADMVAAEFPQVRLVRSQENVGFARGNDALAASSTASHLLLLNSDTVLTEDLVTPLLAALQADPAIALVGPRLVYPDGRPQASSEDFPGLGFEAARLLRGTKAQTLLAPLFDVDARLARARQEDRADDRESRDTDFLWATCWLLRRADVERAGSVFDPAFVTYDEDLDLCRRLRAAGRRIVYVPAVSVVHLGGSSSTSERKRKLMEIGRRRYYRRHHGRATAAAYSALTAAIGLLKRHGAEGR